MRRVAREPLLDHQSNVGPLAWTWLWRAESKPWAREEKHEIDLGDRDHVYGGWPTAFITREPRPRLRGLADRVHHPGSRLRLRPARGDDVYGDMKE